MTELNEELRRQGLMPSTRSQYLKILDRSGNDPLSWLKGRVDGRTPLGTVLPYRAAVKKYMMHVEGYTEEDNPTALCLGPRRTQDLLLRRERSARTIPDVIDTSSPDGSSNLRSLLSSEKELRREKRS